MNYTSIEQSKKLLELGLEPNTADMLWEQHTFDSPYVTVKPWTTKGKSIGAHIIPCWSVGALLKVMPQTNKFHTKVDIEFNRVTFEPYDDEIVQAEDTFHYSDGKTLIEALVNMIVWLLENGYIKTEKK